MSPSTDSAVAVATPARVSRALAAVGRVDDVATWSGIPYYLFQAARQAGFLQIPLALDPRPLRGRRSRWQLTQLLHARRPFGFQYTAEFQRLLFDQFLSQLPRDERAPRVLCHYQMFPPARLAAAAGIEYAHYIDSPLVDLMRDPGISRRLDPATVRRAIDLERETYQGSAVVIGMASWVARSLQQNYGIPAHRLRTVLPGANLPDAAARRLLADRGPRRLPDRFGPRRPLRIGFTGMDWRRKGLARLLEAAERLGARGHGVEVHVIGALPPRLRRHPLVRCHGFIDKHWDAPRFLAALDACDLGCCPSHVEPMGIAPLEYLRLGIPVLCTAVGGLVDACPQYAGAGILAPADASGQMLADFIEPLIRDPETLQRMSDRAWAIKEHYCWSRAVRELAAILDAGLPLHAGNRNQ